MRLSWIAAPLAAVAIAFGGSAKADGGHDYLAPVIIGAAAGAVIGAVIIDSRKDRHYDRVVVSRGHRHGHVHRHRGRGHAVHRHRHRPRGHAHGYHRHAPGYGLHAHPKRIERQVRDRKVVTFRRDAGVRDRVVRERRRDFIAATPTRRFERRERRRRHRD